MVGGGAVFTRLYPGRNGSLPALDCEKQTLAVGRHLPPRWGARARGEHDASALLHSFLVPGHCTNMYTPRIELRDAPLKPLEQRYGRPHGYLDPTAWIKAKQARR